MQLDGIAPDGRLRCTGPGIDSVTTVDLVGLDQAFADRWRENNRLFPRGVDAVFTAGTRLCCLTRTTRLEA